MPGTDRNLSEVGGRTETPAKVHDAPFTSRRLADEPSFCDRFWADRAELNELFRHLAETVLADFCTQAYEDHAVTCAGDTITHEIPVAAFKEGETFESAVAALDAHVRAYASGGAAQRDFYRDANATLHRSGRFRGRTRGDMAELLTFLDTYPIVGMGAREGHVQEAVYASSKKKSDPIFDETWFLAAAICLAVVAVGAFLAWFKADDAGYGDAGAGVLVKPDDGGEESAFLARELEGARAQIAELRLEIDRLNHRDGPLALRPSEPPAAASPWTCGATGEGLFTCQDS